MDEMKRILVLFAHPHPQKSHANSKIVSSLRQLPNVWFDEVSELLRDLYDRRGNEKDMVSRAKQGRDDLEKMLSEEQAQRASAQEGRH